MKFFIKSPNRRLPAGILALFFLLTMVLSEVALSRESQTGEQNILRQASLEWMQMGMQQYRSNQFSGAEKSFRRALVFRKYLTDAEREQLNEFLANARIAISEGKQAVASIQTAKAEEEEKVKNSEPSTAKRQQQTVKEPKIINSQIEQKVRSVKVAEPSVSKIRVEAESSQDVIVVKDKSFNSELMRLSAWLSQNRRNVLMICLPALAVLIFISKLQGIRRRPGRRVYTNQVPANSSFIGSRLAGGNGNNRPVEDSKKGRLAFAAAASPKRKSFEQSTEHWKKEPAGLTPAAGKSFKTSEKWPQRKDKLQAGHSVIAKAGQKQCRKCKETKAHSDFHKDKSCKDGLARWCKECKKQYRKKRSAEKN